MQTDRRTSHRYITIYTRRGQRTNEIQSTTCDSKRHCFTYAMFTNTAQSATKNNSAICEYHCTIFEFHEVNVCNLQRVYGVTMYTTIYSTTCRCKHNTTFHRIVRSHFSSIWWASSQSPLQFVLFWDNIIRSTY